MAESQKLVMKQYGRMDDKSSRPLQWVVVEHADYFFWPKYFDHNPQLNGVSKEFSAHLSELGKELELREVYTDFTAAVADTQLINQVNPHGGYAVCPLNT